MSHAWYARNARTFWFWTIINNYIRESVVMASLQPIFLKTNFDIETISKCLNR